MNPRTKKVLVVLGLLWGIPLAATVALGLWVQSAGTISVRVDERGAGGDHINISVPGALAQVGVFFLPDVVCAEMADGMSEWGTLVRALNRELKDCPDAIFVEVSSPDENVLIRKDGKHLVIDVDSPGETVHLRVPVTLVASLLSKIDDRGGIGSIRIEKGEGCRDSGDVTKIGI